MLDRVFLSDHTLDALVAKVPVKATHDQNHLMGGGTPNYMGQHIEVFKEVGLQWPPPMKDYFKDIKDILS
eukprot:1926788-Lingulodinium_polyedra.AAC.1